MSVNHILKFLDSIAGEHDQGDAWRGTVAGFDINLSLATRRFRNPNYCLFRLDKSVFLDDQNTAQQSFVDELREMSYSLARMPDDDRNVLLFARSPNLFIDEEIFQPPRRDWDGMDMSESDREAFQCGFHAAIDSPAEWFASWITTVADEATEGESGIEYGQG